MNLGDQIAYYNLFEKEKIIWKEMSSEPPFYFDDDNFYTNDTITFLTGSSLKYLLVNLNSKFGFFIFSKYYSGGGLGNKGVRFKKEFIQNIPIPQISQEAQQPFIEKADTMLLLNKQLQEKKTKFLHRVKDNFGATAPDNGINPVEIKLTKKLEAFYDYDFKTFVAELKKQKIKLSLTQQDEWEDYFNAYKTDINQLQAEIAKTDREIDQMVYKLYNLTDEEIKIVEESV